MKLPKWEELRDLHEGPRMEALFGLLTVWENRWEYEIVQPPGLVRRLAREYVSQIRLIDAAQGLTREERGGAQ